MNILLLILTDQSQHPLGRYMDLHHIYDFNNWVEGFTSVPHVFTYFDYSQSFVEHGPLAMEQKILGLVRERSVDLVIVPNICYEINVSFIQMLSAVGAKTLVVFFDDSGRFEDTNRYYVGLCDYIVTHESRTALELYRPYGVTVNFFPCFPSFTFYDRLLAEYTTALPDLGEVSFVGARIADRDEFLGALMAAGLPVSVYGSGWPNGHVSQPAMLQIFRDSKISLNFTKSSAINGSKQLKARAFEIVLAGGFLLTEYDEELVTYFAAGTEIDTFSSLDECVQKTRYYLENPGIREAMRQRGREKCRGNLNFETAWTQYLGCLDSRIIEPEIGPIVGACPTRAVRSFFRWNLSYLVGRIKTRQPRLAIDQLRWFLRDCRFLSGIYSRTVWRVVLSETAWFFLRSVRCRLGKNRLLQRIKRGLHRRLGFGGFVK